MEVTNHDLMVAIQELSNHVKGLSEDVHALKTDVAGLKADVTTLKSDVAELKKDMSSITYRVENLEAEQKLMREEMNLNFRKLDKKIGILAKDIIDVRLDMKLLEEQTS